MKSLILVRSYHHKNTLKVAEVMAQALEADLLDIRKSGPGIITNYDIIGFGSGIYWGKFDKDMLALIDKIPSDKNKKVFVFSTSGMGSDMFNEFAKELLSKKEFNVVGSFACKGFDTFGPFKLVGGINKGHPDDEDLNNARDFALRIKKMVQFQVPS